jgi:hypothetical protein
VWVRQLLTAIWGAALIVIISEESLLISVSRTRKNFSASMVVTLLSGCSSFLPKWIAAKATNEAVASDFALHAQRAILRLSQTVTFPHPYNYWSRVVNLSECLICLSKSGVAPAMLIAETPILFITFATNQSLRPISAIPRAPEGWLGPARVCTSRASGRPKTHSLRSL